MGRLPWATPEVAYGADINDLVAGLYQYEASRRELLEAIFGPVETTPDGAGASPQRATRPASPPLVPLTPERFDAAFSKTRH